MPKGFFNAKLPFFFGFNSISGTEDDDILVGRFGGDVINAGGGDDKVFGLTGKDLLNGGGGQDELHGGRGKDKLFGGEGDDTLDGGLGKDVLEGGNGIDTLIGGAGSDTFVFSGDKFNGATPAAPEAGLILGVNRPDQVEDFDISEDVLALDSEDFGVDSFTFANGLVDDLSGDADLLVVQDVFVNARAAAQAIADNDAITADEGFFVYFNSTLGINRLVYSEDLGDGGAFSVLANLNNLTGEDAITALPDFTADNFELV